MTTEEFNSPLLTDAQRKSMRELQERSGIPWEDFLEQAQIRSSPTIYVAIPNFHGMYVGIEKDGYTHS